MARLVGVDLPREKRLEVALTYIFGIGRTRAAETLAATGISGDLRVHQLTDEQLVALHRCRRYPPQGRDRQLPGPPSPQRSPGAWPAHPDECAHPQGQEEGRGRQEEGTLTRAVS